MSTLSKQLTVFFLSLGLILGFVISNVPQAQAGKNERIAAGVVLGVVGGIILADELRKKRRRHRRSSRRHHRPRHQSHSSHQQARCYRGPRRCRWVGRNCWYNHHDERVCSGGRYKCWRERICD